MLTKTNDLIVRIKLQGEDNSISNFEDVSLPLQVNNSTKENFNISSKPAPANFVKKETTKNNTVSNNVSSDLSNDIPSEILNKNEEMGNNTVNYPTVEYISNDDKDMYFNMISGNEVMNKTNTVETFEDHEEPEAETGEEHEEEHDRRT